MRASEGSHPTMGSREYTQIASLQWEALLPTPPFLRSFFILKNGLCPLFFLLFSLSSLFLFLSFLFPLFFLLFLVTILGHDSRKNSASLLFFSKALGFFLILDYFFDVLLVQGLLKTSTIRKSQGIPPAMHPYSLLKVRFCIHCIPSPLASGL